MVKIHSFSSFARLYEADSTGSTISKSLGLGESPKSKLYDQTLNMILNTILNSYTSLVPFPTSPYDSKIDADLTSVKSSPIDKKVEAFAKIMANVKAASADNKAAGAQETIDAWIAAGTKAAEALTAMLNQYKDQPEEQKHINDFVNSSLESYLKDLENAAKQNTLKAQVSTAGEKAAKESYYYGEGEEIFEGILQGKKGMIEDASKQVTIVLAKLASLANTPGMSGDVQKYQAEVGKIATRLGDLLNMDNKDIEKDEVKKLSARLLEIPTLLDKTAEISLKQDTTNKEAASILVQALALVQTAKDKYKVYAENAEKTKAANTATYSKDKISEVNPVVKKFQELVVDKFKNSKQISGLDAYKKMGTDGKYGPSTKAMVEIMKSGFGLSDTSGETITPELMDELTKQEPLKESRIYSFDSFAGFTYEAFDTGKATTTAQKVTPKAPIRTGGGGGGQKGGQKVKYNKSLLYKKGSTGNPVIAINRIVGQKSDEKNYTDETVDRVKAFQKLNGLYVDGISGEDTITALFNTRDTYKAEPKPKLNDEGALRGPWAYKTLADLLGQSYQLPQPEKNKISSDIGEIFRALAKASFGAGTEEVDFVKAIRRIKSADDVKMLNAMFDQAARNKTNSALRTTGVLAVVTACFPVTAPFTGAAALGTFIGAELGGWNYHSLAGVINGEFGVSAMGDDTAYVQQIAEHLNKISGVKASFEERDGKFVDNTFSIVV